MLLHPIGRAFFERINLFPNKWTENLLNIQVQYEIR